MSSKRYRVLSSLLRCVGLCSSDLPTTPRIHWDGGDAHEFPKTRQSAIYERSGRTALAITRLRVNRRFTRAPRESSRGGPSTTLGGSISDTLAMAGRWKPSRPVLLGVTFDPRPGGAICSGRSSRQFCAPNDSRHGDVSYVVAGDKWHSAAGLRCVSADRFAISNSPSHSLWPVGGWNRAWRLCKGQQMARNGSTDAPGCFQFAHQYRRHDEHGDRVSDYQGSLLSSR